MQLKNVQVLFVYSYRQYRPQNVLVRMPRVLVDQQALVQAYNSNVCMLGGPKAMADNHQLIVITCTKESQLSCEYDTDDFARVAVNKKDELGFYYSDDYVYVLSEWMKEDTDYQPLWVDNGVGEFT